MRQMCFWFISAQCGFYDKFITWFIVSGFLVFSMVFVRNLFKYTNKPIFIYYSDIIVTEKARYALKANKVYEMLHCFIIFKIVL